MSGALQLLAPAKVNLYLHITERRADGYHGLDSLTVFADCGDILRAEPAQAGALTLEITGPIAPALADDPLADNLVWRAAEALRSEAGRPDLGAALTLTKHLPVAAGLGGGSADAAAALRLLNTLWDLRLPADRLVRLALSLGADVPVCLAGGAARMTGIGERLEPVAALPECWLVLINTGAPVPTGPVFKALDPARFTGPYAGPDWSRPHSDVQALAGVLASHSRNDLELTARSLEPSVGGALSVLAMPPDAPAPLLVRMSGSGGTCFGLFAGPGDALRAQRALHEAHPTWWIEAAPVRSGPAGIEPALGRG